MLEYAGNNLNLVGNKYKLCVNTNVFSNIDEFLKENNLKTNFDLVSLDTQGHDFEILNSSEIILNSKLIVIETAKVELYEGQVIDEEIEKFLINKGYRKEYYHEFHQVWGDTLFVKN